METNYRKMTVRELRVEAQAAGWTGTDRFNMTKGELVHFMATGELPPIRYELDGDKLTISRRPDTVAELLELAEKLIQELPEKSVRRNSGRASPEKTNKREKGRGRPKVVPPTDTAPFVTAVAEAYRQGRPFRKTSARGVYVRRSELPTPFNALSKHGLERLVAHLLKDGRLQLIRGDLSA